MHRKTTVALVAFFLALLRPVSAAELPMAEPETVGMSSEKLALIGPAMQQFVDDQQVAGAITIVVRKGKVVFFEAAGKADIGTGQAMQRDTIVRIYSMSKPITSVAIMMLVEEGKLALDDPVAKLLPELGGVRVFKDAKDGEFEVEELNRPVTIRDLLRHTSGLTYGFFGNTPVDQRYREVGVLGSTGTLADMVTKLGELPLLYQPGTRFNYSVSSDVLGRVVEVASRQEFDEFLQDRIFAPLDMKDTGFFVPKEKLDRFATSYSPKLLGSLAVSDAPKSSRYREDPSLLSGGGGLVSTARDYSRFCQMLLNNGQLDGKRLLRAETVQAMTKNQLPDEAYPINLGGKRDGVGFGLGFSVVVENNNGARRAKLGEYGWDGAASTHFRISPDDDLAIVVLTQLMPFNSQVADAVKPLVYDAILPSENWPRFRGPNADGVAPDNSGLPTTWTTTENVRWVADVPGWGWSCPTVWGDRVFLTSVISDESDVAPSKGLYLGQGVREPAKGIHHWMVHCFDLNSGEELWSHEVHTGRPQVPRHPKSTYATETATTDGQRLYVLFGDVGLYCYDLDGKPLWSREFEPKKTFFDYGAATSPIVHDGQVIVVYDNLEESWIAAFDAETGADRWRRTRDETHSWATPFVWTNELRTEIVVPGKRRNRSYSPDGELLWEFDGKMSNLVIPSPFAAHGLCYIASGYVGDDHRPTFAVRPGATGDITPDGDFENSEFIAWYQGKSSSYNPSQIVCGDYLYTLFDRGFLTCHNAKTGEEIYGKQRFSPTGSFTSSPWAYNGHLFFLSEDGLTYVVQAGPEFAIVERNQLDELCISTPAIVGDKLLIRTASKVYCLTEGSQLDSAAASRLQPRRSATAGIDIWAAAAGGDRKRVLQLLASGTSVDVRQPGSGSTLLNTAVVFGQTEMAKLLIEKGADVSIANADGNTALHIAAFFTHVELVRLLLENGASVSAKSGRGETPLDVVAADWNPQLEGFYKTIGRLIGTELDFARIQEMRPKIAKLLREHTPEEEISAP